MRAREISEAVKNNLPVIAQSAHGVWYETDVAQVKNWHKKTTGFKSRIDVDPAIRHFVFVKHGDTLWGPHNIHLGLHKGNLDSMQGNYSFHSTQDGENLAALVQATNAQSGPRVWGDFVIYKGHVYAQDDFPAEMPQVGQISTGAVYEIPPDLWWALRKLRLKYLLTAQRVIMFKSTPKNFGESWCAVSIKDGKLSDIQSQRKLDAATQVKLAKELSQALGLQQKVSVKTHIIPESKLHDVLRAVMDNPGVTRWDLYLTVLRLRQVPAERSPADAVHELAQMNLISNVNKDPDGIVKYAITPIGKLVLARVNAGHAVAKVSLIKS